jgi:class 3 adenylate cyclase
MGDGIFAVFGAPIEMPDHADRALAAALGMICERVRRFNARLRAMGLKLPGGGRAQRRAGDLGQRRL